MKQIYKQLILLAFILVCGLFGMGCNTINPKEQTPTYIHIDSFHFKANPLFHVTASHQITTVWAYYNNNPVGVFDLPCTFPILTTPGDTMGKLELSAGVAVNGLNNSLSGYPFYAFDTSDFKVQAGKIINYTPTTEFFNNLSITTISNFEGLTHFGLVAYTGGNIPMTVVNDDSLLFEGSGTGSILLSSPGDSSIDSTSKSFTIPFNKIAFIEFDYKCSVPFYVGMQSNQGSLISSTPYYLTGVNASDHWQKFYLNVGNFVSSFQGTDYNLYIKTSLPDGYTRGRVLIDNIQLVTF